MLRLKGIEKFYKTGDGGVLALKGIDINFRNSEFVSVLGPSGCGKTTLLNIIGGLDHYTAGEMSIDGVSTKEYGDRDWDTYRNERIGFVFQSYNLIPQQTIQGNVELALTIAGVGRQERARRAMEALDKVGLKGLYNKKPNQLSGGQCQRVAIARALVNEPEILLADEPTGALDTVTSVQIMDLIKEIAGEKLVIMVTHNPELARQYSTRIVELLDGKIVGDSDPYSDEECAADERKACVEGAEDKSFAGEEEGCGGEEDKNLTGEEASKSLAEGKSVEGEGVEAEDKADTEKKGGRGKRGGKRKSKLSLGTAFSLSARNLRAKLKRTIMVCIAGSIGIIGVASVLAVSTGVQNYITDMQNDMLSGNPVTVQESGYDLSTITDMMNGGQMQDVIESSVEDGYVNVDAAIDRLVEMADMWGDFTFENEITKEYVEYVKAMPKEYYSAMSFGYGADMSYAVYTNYDTAGGEKRYSLYAADSMLRAVTAQAGHEDVAQALSGTSGLFSLAPDSNDFILSQYDIVNEGGYMPKEKGEVMLVINDESQLTDLVLAQLGYYTQDEILNIVYKATEDERYDADLDKSRFSYEELLGKTFTLYSCDDIYTIDGSRVTYDPSYGGEGTQLKITAILRPKEGLSFGSLSTGVYYTQALEDYVTEANGNSELAAFIDENGKDGALSGIVMGGTVVGGVPTFELGYTFEGNTHTQTVCVGSELSVSGSTYYSLTLRDIGGNSLPSTISVYPVDFELKDGVTAYLNAWNEDGDITVNGKVLKAEERAQITYTDNLSVIISMIGDMIDIVTYALVAFTALSLVVSTVMIAIITYVSVIERIKEIGVIRSLGGRKKDVSRLFNAETFIIGLISGVIGIAITYVICLIINGIVGAALGISGIASLPFTTALILIAVSVLLTLISGLIPARLAAKKDPVEALRSE